MNVIAEADSHSLNRPIAVDNADSRNACDELIDQPRERIIDDIRVDAVLITAEAMGRIADVDLRVRRKVLEVPDELLILGLESGVIGLIPGLPGSGCERCGVRTEHDNDYVRARRNRALVLR